MFKSLMRKIRPNPLDQILRKAQKKKQNTFLLGWNRGLGDIALGLYGIVHRIKEYVPEAEITFLIRKNLEEGFSLFPGVKVLVAPDWERGKSYSLTNTLQKLQVAPTDYDVIIEKPDPTYWIAWQRGKITPKLTWEKKYDLVADQLLPQDNYTYVGVQPCAETSYGLWRNWPKEKWDAFFSLAEKQSPHLRFLLFGFAKMPPFLQENVRDFRSTTNLFEVLSLIKNRCKYVILPDSGILSMVYYLNVSFPLTVLSLWGDPRHGILKQKVRSPNPKLVHIPIIGEYKNLSSVSEEDLLSYF